MEQPNAAFGKIAYQLLQHGDRRVMTVPNTENQLEVGIILAAEAREVIVGFGVQSSNRL